MLREEPATSVLTHDFFRQGRALKAASAYIRSMHPKTSIRPSPEAVLRILAAGWVGQLKIHGHRAQLHVPADPQVPVLVYTRHGQPHRKALPPTMESEIRRLFQPKRGWNTIDGEWVKTEDKLFVFDFLKKEGKVLRTLTYPARWKLLPRLFLSPHIVTLPLLSDPDSCLKVLKGEAPQVEGLVFKSTTSKGFGDTSIIRCRIRR
jgi:ATP-dependent DNA ligase